MLKKNNPHDKFVQETLDKKENAISFLKNYLPEDLKELINPEKIEIEKDSYITEELDEYFSDLLYKVDINGREGYIYVLLEHKSYQDAEIGLQLLEYLLQIWKDKKDQRKKLPVVLPLVIYHGQKEWKVSNSFSDLIDYDEEVLEQYIPDFLYLLYDLSQYDDEEILGTKELRFRLKILKYIRSKKFLDKFGNILDILADEFDIEDIKPIVMYVYNVRDDEWDKFSQKIKERTNSGGEVIMTIAEQLEKKGKKEGKREGKREGKKEVAKNMLKDGFDIDHIAGITGLSVGKIKKIKKNVSE